MKRVGYHGNDLERIEKLNALSRRICAEVPGTGRGAALAQGDSGGRAQLRHGCLLSRQLHCCGRLLLRLRRHGMRLAVGGAERPDHRLCHALARPARGQPVFQHHRGVVSHGPAGIYRGRAGLARLRGRSHHRRADAACAGAVDHKLHARHHLRRHQLRRQPNRAGAALGVCHRARHGGRVARHRAALWPCRRQPQR